MAIEIVPCILLPTLDSDRFERCSFALSDARSSLTITMRELPQFIVHFHKLRWHRFTPAEACNAGLTQGCDFAVAEVRNSPALRAYVAREKVPDKVARKLRHYRLYLGPGGCHEAFARSAYASGSGPLSRRFAALLNEIKLLTGFA